MRYMYTTKPEEGCHEVELGIYGRPVQTSEQPKLKQAGWSYSIDSLRGTDHVRQEKEGREEEREVSESMDFDEFLKRKYEEVIGKKPHHKMKRETMQEKIAEAEFNG